MTSHRPRVAYFSPLAPDPSGISAYSELLLPYLAEHWDLVLFVDGYVPIDSFAASLPRFDCHAADPVPHLAKLDAVVYHMGNSASHAYIYDTLMAWPGLVVLHELSIHHFIAGRTAALGRLDLYLHELRKQHGAGASEEARRSFYGSQGGLWDLKPDEYTLNRHVLDQATGVLCHSEFVSRAVAEVHPRLCVRVSRHPAWPQAHLHERSNERRRDRLRLLAAGNLTPNKAIDEVVRACAVLGRQIPLELRLVGRVELGFDVEALARIEGLEHLTVRGRVDDGELMLELRDADLCFALRSPTLGESSGIVLRALSVGTPVVVSDTGWFGELPDEVAVKVPVPIRRHDPLVESLRPVLRSGNKRERMSRAALDYARESTPDRTAADYVEWAREAGSYPAAMTGRAFRLLTEHARELGIEEPAATALRRAEIFRQLMGWQEPARRDWLCPPEHLAPVARGSKE